MKIAVFFTYDYSLSTLESIGILERELEIYLRIKKKFKCNFIFFTYDEEIEQINKYDFEFFPIYKYIKKPKNKLVRLFKSFIIPFKIKSHLSNIDVLHQHQLLGVWIPLILKFILKKPLLTRTGYDAFQFSIKNNENRLKIFFYKLLTNIALKYSNLYTVTSFSDFNFLKSYFGVNNIKVVPNWIKLSNKIEFKNRKLKILMVGRLEMQKNYSQVIELLKTSDIDLEVDVYGSGSEQNKLETISKEESLKINFLGNISNKRLIEVYKTYRIFLSTSLYEGNPKTVLEALSQGCIVVASDIENHREIIENNVNGFLFKDLKELNDILSNIYQDSDLAIKFFKNSFEILNKNKIETIVDIIYQDYKSLI